MLAEPGVCSPPLRLGGLKLALPYGQKAADALLGFRDPPWITKPPPKKRKKR